jgi:creatinine amidohydrolase
MTAFSWARFSTAVFASRDLSNTVVVLPVGAIEQHGPHLPVSVDAAINAGVLADALGKLDSGADVLVLPPLPYGKSDEHIAFPGTIAIPAPTLAAIWFEIATSVARAGARKIVFFNSHGGQIALVDIVCRDIRVKLGMLAVACSWFRITPVGDIIPAQETTHGIHGGDLETSVMLHLHGDLVAFDKAEDFVPLTVEIEASGSLLTAEGAVGFGWQAQDLHPKGVAGNAKAATAEKGRLIVDRGGSAFVALLADVAAFDMERLTKQTAFAQH